MAGATIPLTTAVHQMISVGPISLSEKTASEIEYPIVRDTDTFMCERQNGNDIEVGSYAYRPPLEGQGVYPRPFQEKLPIWVAVGGTPESVVRAGTLGLPLALAIIGGMPEQFAPLVELYYRAAQHAGHDPSQLSFSINSHGYIADESQQAIDEAFPSFQQVMNKIGRERGWPGMTRSQFEASSTLRGANFIGSPDDIIEKILFQHQIFGHHRLLLMLSVGTMPHDKVMHAVELLGTKVAPVVRREIANRTSEGSGEQAG